MSNCSDAASPPKRLCTRTSRAHASPRIFPARRVPSISPGSGSMIITPCVAAALCRCCHGRDADTFNHLSGMRPQPYAPPQRTFAPACTPTARPTTTRAPALPFPSPAPLSEHLYRILLELAGASVPTEPVLGLRSDAMCPTSSRVSSNRECFGRARGHAVRPVRRRRPSVFMAEDAVRRRDVPHTPLIPPLVLPPESRRPHRRGPPPPPCAGYP